MAMIISARRPSRFAPWFQLIIEPAGPVTLQKASGDFPPAAKGGRVRPHRFWVQIFYEDTDHSGVVYHANYLKYFERAREAVIGAPQLVHLWRERGLGFAVYKASLDFQDGAEFGERLEIRSTWRRESDYRLIWSQEAWRPEASRPAVRGEIHLVCLDRQRRLQPIPAWTPAEEAQN
jgi:YbgC/YbaW family acyl-CoA thioester hydrolase